MLVIGQAANPPFFQPLEALGADFVPPLPLPCAAACGACGAGSVRARVAESQFQVVYCSCDLPELRLIAN